MVHHVHQESKDDVFTWWSYRVQNCHSQTRPQSWVSSRKGNIPTSNWNYSRQTAKQNFNIPIFVNNKQTTKTWDVETTKKTTSDSQTIRSNTHQLRIGAFFCKAFHKRFAEYSYSCRPWGFEMTYAATCMDKITETQSSFKLMFMWYWYQYWYFLLLSLFTNPFMSPN